LSLQSGRSLLIGVIKPRLTFHAPDGATVAFTETFQYAQGIVTGDDLVDVRIAERGMEVVLQLGDGNWRIHHWRVLKDYTPVYPRLTFGLAEEVRGIRGVNYIARNAPFAAFWSNFNVAEVDADFATIQSLRLNTVRFFIPYPALEDVEKTFATFLELAERHNLQVIPTLLDGYTDYGLEDMPKVLACLETTRHHKSGWLAWTLYDLLTGKMSDGHGVERQMGLLEVDGTPKLAVWVVQGSRGEAPTFVDELFFASR
jgi:hypothetical protein